MNVTNIATAYRMPEKAHRGRSGNGQISGFGVLPTRSDLILTPRTVPDDRLSYLKVLAMSLLREIEALEGLAEGNRDEDVNLQGEVRRFEAELIRSALVRTGGRQRRAARLLGMKVTTLNTKIKRYRITVDGADCRGDVRDDVN